MSDLELWLKLNYNLCVLYGSPNSPQGYNDIKLRTDILFKDIRKQFPN